MSAFICNTYHVCQLVAYAANHQHEKWDREKCQEVADILYRENFRSVNARYPGHQQEYPGITYRPSLCNPLSPVQFFKALDCLAYQSCEAEGWKESKAHELIEDMRYVGWHSLPGYEAAEWELTPIIPAGTVIVLRR